MRDRLFACLALLAALVALPGEMRAQEIDSATTPFRPVALVNDEVVTAFDLIQRTRMLQILGSSGSAEQIQREALNQLIEERLKLQAAKRAGLNSSLELVTQGIEDLAQRLGLSAGALQKGLNDRGVGDQTLVDYAMASELWREVVRGRFGRRVEPSEDEIDERIQMTRNRGVTAYRLRELGLAFRDRGEAETRTLAASIHGDLVTGGSFPAAARRHSVTPSRPKGGDVGWVPTDSLPPTIQASLEGLNPGEVTEPIELPTGITILKVEEIRRADGAATDGDDPQLREQIRRSLSTEQINRLADGLLQELRRDAMIELR